MDGSSNLSTGQDDPSSCNGIGCPSGGNSQHPIRYFNGEVQFASTDLAAGGFGTPWQQRRVYSNRLSSNADVGNGYNWLVQDWPYLVQGSGNSITFMRGTRYSLQFEYDSGNYTGRFGAKSTLIHDIANHLFVLTQPNGQQWKFHDFSQFTYPQGQFASHLTPGDQAIEATSYTGDDRIETLERSVTVDSVTTTEAFAYTYTTGGRIETATLRRKVDSGNWEDIRQVEYAYYGSGDSNGSKGDLKSATRSEWNGTSWDSLGVSYYRYWLSGQSGGFQHGLKYILEEASYARMLADGYDPFTANNAQVALYADNYFEYDGQQRVTKEIVYGGSQEFAFSYTPSNNFNDYNHWKMKTVESRPDGSEVTVFTNYIGQVLLKKLQSGSDTWLEYHKFDADGREILMAEPSAISSYNDSSADLNVALKTSEGLIHLTEYYPPASSSSSSSDTGGPAGYKKAEKLQEGSNGTPILQKSWTYTSHSAGVNTIYPQATETVYRNDDGTGEIVTSFSYTFYSGTLQMQQITTTLPVVPASQNGSGIAATRKVCLDEYSNQIWSMDERGYITRFKYDLTTGAMTQRINDVDTAIEMDAPSGWTTPSDGGLNLITDYEYDDEGRIIQTLGPWHTIDIDGTATNIRRASWMVYDENASQDITRTGQGYATDPGSGYVYTLVNPVSIAINAKNGKSQQQIQATRASTSGKLLPSDTFAQSQYTRWTTFQYTDCCNLASQRVYHTIPSTGNGSSGTNYDQIDYGYDSMKRRNRNVTPGGTITRTVFDPRGLALSSWMGTDDTEATASDPTGGGATGNNMVIIAELQFDGGLDGGNGNITQQIDYVSGSENRATYFTYDFRNRPIVTDGEVDFYEVSEYDNLNQVVKTERYDTTGSGNLVARGETKFDSRRQIYRTILYGVDPSTGTVGNSLTSNTWYDTAGNEIKTLPAGSDMFTKSSFDSLSRLVKRFHGYDLNESGYEEAGSVTDDTILEQSEFSYDNASNRIQRIAKRRYHNAISSQTGELGDPLTEPKARVSYAALYPDAIGREQAVANYGTNGGAPLMRSATIPGRSDTLLVASRIYNNAGNLSQAVDASGRVLAFEYDHLGRTIRKIKNYHQSGSSSSSGLCANSDDVNITYLFSYNSDGNVISVTSQNATTGDQEFQSTYGTTLSDSDVASSLLKRQEIYPDSIDSSNVTTFSYNRQGQQTNVVDQNGTVHSYIYDKLGRVTHDRVASLGTGVDGAVRRLTFAYSVRDKLESVASYDHPDLDSGNVVNEAQFTYNDFGQIIADYQAHGGAVSTSTSPKVQYAYANGSANTIRPTSLIYPNGRVLTYEYGTADEIDDAVSRIAALVDDDGPNTHLVDYEYLGIGNPARSANAPLGQGFVIADYTQPTTKWTMVDLSNSNDPETGDIYSGLDRFGRVKDDRWRDYASSSDLVRIKYGYDRAGNRIWRQNMVANGLNMPFDELYGNDAVNRLKGMERGTLNAQRNAIAAKSLGECWSLDETGNWKKFLEDSIGSGSWDLNQTRTANTVNEITDITETTGPSWETPAYNPAGNMTTIPQPSDPTNAYSATYDAWNRLVKLVDGSDTVAEYEYDGVERRCVVKSYVSGSMDETRHYYFSDPAKWQVIEERVDESTNAERQYVWGLRYIDDLVLRDRETNTNSSLDERLYSLQDAHWNVTALSNTNGAIVERFEYSPYGKVSYLNSNFAATGPSSVDWQILFTGRSLLSSSVHLYDFRHRVYIAPIGVFLTRDPRELSDAFSTLYEFALSNPIVILDPSGLAGFTPYMETGIDVSVGGKGGKGLVFGGSVGYKLYKESCCPPPNSFRIVEEVSVSASVGIGAGLKVSLGGVRAGFYWELGSLFADFKSECVSSCGATQIRCCKRCVTPIGLTGPLTFFNNIEFGAAVDVNIETSFTVSAKICYAGSGCPVSGLAAGVCLEADVSITFSLLWNYIKIGTKSSDCVSTSAGII